MRYDNDIERVTIVRLHISIPSTLMKKLKQYDILKKIDTVITDFLYEEITRLEEGDNVSV